MTPEQLALIAGVVLSLAFSYLPGLKQWFDTLSSDQKRLVMLAVLFLTTAALFGLSCASLFSFFACTWLGAWDALQVFILAAVANQTAYMLAPGIKRK